MLWQSFLFSFETLQSFCYLILITTCVTKRPTSFYLHITQHKLGPNHYSNVDNHIALSLQMLPWTALLHDLFVLIILNLNSSVWPSQIASLSFRWLLLSNAHNCVFLFFFFNKTFFFFPKYALFPQIQIYSLLKPFHPWFALF